jgi:hypothetical protein
MHRLLFAALSVSVLVSIGSVSPAAAARDRYCLQGVRWGFPGNCQFSNRSQYLASASGTGARCGLNPRYSSAPQRR